MIFNKFAHSFVDNKIAQFSDDISPIYEYFDAFINHVTYENIGLEELIHTTEGYFFL